MNRKIIIAISGKSGCGNSTVSKIVAKSLNLKLINYTFRNMAEEKGMDFKEFYKIAADDTAYDLLLDKKQVKMASGGNCVLGSRLAIWIMKDADLKVFLEASPEVRAGRVNKREQRDFKEVLKETYERDTKDSKRYLSLYNINNDDYGFADLIIHTDNLNPEKIAEKIVFQASKYLMKPQ